MRTVFETSRHADAARALRIVESMPGFAWSADATGRFTYVSPSALTFLGEAPDSLNATEGADEFGWRGTVHPDDYDRVAARWRHCLATGDHYDTEHRLRRADGAFRWVRNSGRAVRDGAGRITEWFGTTIDIDEQKQAEAALRAREQELSQLVDMVPSHLWRLAPDGEPIFVSKRMTDFLGLDVIETDRPGKSRLDVLIDCVHPDDAADFRETLGRCLVTGESFSMKYRLRRADGAYRWMSSRAEPMRDEAGRIVQWHGLCHDVDHQIDAEWALRRSEQQLRQLVDTVPVAIWCTTRDGGPGYRNKRHADATGATPSKARPSGGYASPLAVMAHPDDLAAAEEVRRRAYETGGSYLVRYRQIRSDGTYRWTESRAEPLRDENGEIIQWYGVSIDIHDMVTAQEALRRNEEEMSQLVNMLPVHIRRLSPTGETIFFNKRLVDFVGMDLTQLGERGMRGLAGTVQTFIHPDDSAGLQETIRHSLATGESYATRYRVRRADGVYRWMEGRGEPLRDQNGVILQWYGISIDIDDAVRAEEALRQSEQLYRALFHYMPIPLWRLNTSRLVDLMNSMRAQGVTDLGRHMDEHPDFLEQAIDLVVIEEVNRSVAELFGSDGETGLTGSVNPYWQAGNGKMRRSFEARFRGEQSHAEQVKITTHDGRVLEGLHTSAFPSELAELGISISSFVDNTERIQAQEKLHLAQESLARASQAASLAELSASIAHEVNQPLAAIVANAQALHRWLSAEPPNVERARITAERITRDAHSAADVVSRIRALFRHSIEPRSSAPLPGIIAEARSLIADEAARRHTRIDVDVESDLPLVALDRTQIQQVLINLMRNGMDAMESMAGERGLAVRVRRMDGTIQTEVSDRGHGVASPDKIFEPFFTTKEHGMGMGLAICRSIVESHGGRLWVEKNQPQGATFIFTLPVEENTTV